MNRDLSFNLVRRIMDLNQYLGMMNADASFIRILIADQSSEVVLSISLIDTEILSVEGLCRYRYATVGSMYKALLLR